MDALIPGEDCCVAAAAWKSSAGELAWGKTREPQIPAQHWKRRPALRIHTDSPGPVSGRKRRSEAPKRLMGTERSRPARVLRPRHG